MTQTTENIINILFSAKTELKIFFTVWLCLFFILSPVFLGLQLTPKILVPETKAWPSVFTTAFTAASEYIVGAWSTVQNWAVHAWDWIKANIKDILYKALVMALQLALHQVLMMVTNSIIKWIQSDFHGQPGFVTDWKSYLKKAGQSAGGRFLNQLAGVNLCGPFKLQLQVALSFPYPNFETQAACTLDGILANVNSTIADFQKDFRKGGWIAFEESLKPNNNAFGAWLMAMDAKHALEFAAIQNAQKESQNGFKPTKKCMSATSAARVSNAEINKSSCDTMLPIINAGPQPGKEEEYNTTVAAYQKMCTGTSAPVTKEDASKVDPASPECTSSIVTAPDGTVEFTTNFAANSTLRSLEQQFAKLTGEGGSQFMPYVTAIANALITQLVKDGTNGLLGMMAEKRQTDVNQGILKIPALDEFDAISKDFAIIDRILGNLDRIDGNASGIKYSISNTKTLVDLTKSIGTKQDSVMNDLWTSGVWDNKMNDANGTETVDDDAAATTIDSKTISSTIENCTDTKNVLGNITTSCVPTSTTNPPYPTSTLTNYTRTSTTTATTYEIAHPRIGKISLTEIKNEIKDGRTTSIDNIIQKNYDTASFSFSLIPPPQNQIEDIDGIASSYQNKLNTLQNMTNLAGSTRTAVNNFKLAADKYQKDFSNNPESAITIASREKTKATRTLAISALQSLTGSDKKSLEELDIELENMLNGQSMDSAQNITTTTTTPDGTQSTETPQSKYQTYLNDVIVIYNSLLSAKNSGYLSPIGTTPTMP